jgi:hypothetical protein
MGKYIDSRMEELKRNIHQLATGEIQVCLDVLN